MLTREQIEDMGSGKILWETCELLVYTYGSNELFVMNKKAGVTARVSSYWTDGLAVTVQGNGRLNPFSVNGLPAFTVTSK